MAHVETGHIHLRSSILHHTESWETKSLGKKKKYNSKNTQKHKDGYGHTCTHADPTHTRRRSYTDLICLCCYGNTQARSLQHKNLKHRKPIIFHHSLSHQWFYRQKHTQRATHDPLSSRKWWNMKWSITAWNGSLPRTMLVLCHIVFHCQKNRERSGRKKGRKETVNSGKKNKLGFFLFFIIYFWNFLYGNSKQFQTLSTAQPEVWESAQAFHMYEVWQKGKQPPT